MFNLLCYLAKKAPEYSELLSEQTFYRSFLVDLIHANSEVIIESPYITASRMRTIYPVLLRLREKGVRITVNTRDPYNHNLRMRIEAIKAIADMQKIGVKVMYTGGLHRKIAIIDREILYEGSLNILSQYDSCEIMRKITGGEALSNLFRFLNIY